MGQGMPCISCAGVEGRTRGAVPHSPAPSPFEQKCLEPPCLPDLTAQAAFPHRQLGPVWGQKGWVGSHPVLWQRRLAPASAGPEPGQVGPPVWAECRPSRCRLHLLPFRSDFIKLFLCVGFLWILGLMGCLPYVCISVKHDVNEVGDLRSDLMLGDFGNLQERGDEGGVSAASRWGRPAPPIKWGRVRKEERQSVTQTACLQRGRGPAPAGCPHRSPLELIPEAAPLGAGEGDVCFERSPPGAALDPPSGWGWGAAGRCLLAS